MRTRNHSLGPVLLLLLALGIAVSCQSPVEQAPYPSLGEDQTRIVVQAAGARALDLTEADYLTLQLGSADGSEIHHASALGGGTGTYSLVVEGLVSGDWSLRVRLYAYEGSASLLFYANVTHYVEAGRTNTLNIDLYPAASIAGVSVTEAVEGLEVEVEDWEQGPWSPLEDQRVFIGQSKQLHAEVVGAGGVPASDQRVLWKTSDESVLEVSSQGVVRGVSQGRAALTATSVTGKKIALFTVSVDQGLVGRWETFEEGSDGVVRPRALLLIQTTESGTLEAALWTAFREETGTLAPVGRSTFLFVPSQVATSTNGSVWNQVPAEESHYPVVATQTSADILVWQGGNLERGLALANSLEFRRSPWRIDTVGSPLSTVAVKKAVVGQTRDLDVVKAPWEATDFPLVWSSSRPDVATVDADGVVSFEAPGPVSIRATVVGTPSRVFRVDFQVEEAVTAGFQANFAPIGLNPVLGRL